MSETFFSSFMYCGLAVVTAFYGSVSAEYVCTGVGYFCADCKTLVYCSGFDQHVLTCPTNIFCSQERRDCSATTCSDLTCKSHPFECTQEGNFPDLLNCNNYVVCPSPGSTGTLQSCPQGIVFDPCIGSCSSNTVCHNPPTKCTGVGDKGPVPNNPEMYYVCEEDFTGNCIYPKLNKCNNGIFNITSETCATIGVDVCLT